MKQLYHKSMEEKSAIIIIQDENMSELLNVSLENMSFRSVLAKDMNQCKFKFDNERFDLIIIDDAISGAHTEVFVKNLRFTQKYRYNDKTPILILTENFKSLPPNLSLISDVAFLERPFTKDVVIDSIEQLLLVNESKRAGHGKKITLEEGELIIREGEKESKMYLIKSGELEIFKGTEDQKIPLGKVRPGEILGEMSFLDGSPRSASAVACCPTVLYEIPSEKFMRIINKQPKWVKVFIETLCQRLRSADERLTL